MVAQDSDNAEDLPQPSGVGTSASIVSTSTPAADGKLIGFSCPVCGYLCPAETRQPAPAPSAPFFYPSSPPRPGPGPLCAGSKPRTGRRHEPAPMVALLD